MSTSWAVALRIGLVVFGSLVALGFAEALLALLGHGESPYLGLTREFSVSLLEPHAVLHHRPRIGADGVVGGVRYRFDELGLRGAGLRSVTLAVGDSVTMGWGVPEGSAWPSLLRPRAMNGGVLGYGIQESVRRAAQLLDALPDVRTLVVGYYPNDPESAVENSRRQDVSSWRLVRLVERALAPPPTAAQRYATLHQPGTATLERVDRGFADLASLKAARGLRVVVVLVPALEAVADGRYALLAVHESVAGRARAYGLEVLNLAPTLVELDSGGPSAHWVAPDDPHPNAAAHAAYAAAINRALTQAP